jgi:2-keto-3-deoxy-L-rhamnonate aldolase RhmA
MKLKTNRVKKILKEGGTCFGTLLRMVKAPEVIPLSTAAGWDYVIIDTEHYASHAQSIADLAVVARYEPLTLLVRVQDKLYHQVASTLDLGVQGLILPRVQSREEVEHILHSTRYFPQGGKGASISTTATLFRDYGYQEYMQSHNENLLTVVQIETEDAVEIADDIVSVDGVDAVMMGPADLSQNMGIPGEFDHPRMEVAYQKVIDACNRHGVAPGIHFGDMKLAQKWVRRGMRFMTFQFDSQLLQGAFERAVEDLRSSTSST